MSKELRDKYEKERFDAEQELDLKKDFLGAFLKVFDEKTITELERDGVSPGFQAIFDLVRANIDDLDGLYDTHDLADKKLEVLYELREKSIAERAKQELEGELGLPTGSPLGSELFANTTHPKTMPPTPAGPKLSEIIEDFIAFKRSGKKRFGASAVESYETAIADLIFVIGDMPVNSVTFDHACQFRDIEQRLPKHRNKNERYQSKSSDELVALNIPNIECISARTTSDRLGSLRGIFSWLTASGRANRNPFDGVSCEYEDNPTPKFTRQDLNDIFASALYSDSTYSRSAFASASHWWLPLLSLWTGARPSELVQLRLDDIQVMDGILTAEVVDDDDTGQRGKTKAARRVFPIHPSLLQLGFEDYLNCLRQAGVDRLLNGIPLGSRKPGSEAGKWFNERYRANHLPSRFKAEDKVLYSFRCTYITEALNAGVELRDLQQMVGHEKAQLKATKSYDRGQTITALYEGIQKIGFNGLNQSHLIGGWQKLKRL